MPEGCFTWVGSGLNFKHQTRLEEPASGEHSSLLSTFVNYGRNFFIIMGAGQRVGLLIRSVILDFYSCMLAARVTCCTG